ncbi:MAG TPA: ABC transporter permease [Candidatus Alistipes merdipullorum]|nr:ABC transporter permease [Candidatus Alistipes merdipullorum]
MVRWLPYFIAGRYLRSRKSHSVINIISGVSVAAMATPVAAMVILLSVFNGLEGMVRTLYRAVDADITIRAAEGTVFDAAAVDTAAIRAAEGVETLSLVLEQGAMAEVGDRRTIVRLRGVERTYEDVVPVAQTIYGGTFAVGVDDSRSVVLGHRTAQELGMSRQAAGDMVTLYAINRARFSSLLPVGGYTRRTLPVAGFYSIDDENGDVAYVSLDVAQDMFNYEGRASSVAVKLAAGADADAVAERLQRIAGEGMEVLTRERSNSIYRLMALEKWGVFAVALIVLVVASLTVVGTIVMIMIDKRDDAATLRMMGANRATVRDIFVGEGHLLAGVSLVLGVAAGVGLTLLQQTVGLVRLQTATLMVDIYPVELHAADVLLTAAAYIVVAHVVTRLTVGAMLKDNATI